MNLVNQIIEVAASLAETLIIVRLCNKFLDYKHRDWRWLKSGISFILLAAENILLGQREGSEDLCALLLLVLIEGYVILFFQGKIYEKILIAFFPVVTILLINLLVINALRVLSGNVVRDIILPGGRLRLQALLFSKLAFFFVCELLIQIRKRVRYILSGYQWTIQLSCFVITFLISYLLRDISLENGEPLLLCGINVMIVILNVLFYVIMGKMHYDNIIKEEYRVSKMSLAAQERFVGEAREQYLEMRTLRHDMRHYLSTAAELISADRADEARVYIEKIIDEKVNQTAAGVDTGNVVIDAVINSRIADCIKLGIQVKCMIDSQFGEISDTDVSIILSNALDNAIRGCAGTDSPEIELVLGRQKVFTRIVVKNTIAESVLRKNPKLETDKEDRTVHGFGITSMRRIADNYGGSVEFREEDHYFIAEIWLEGTQKRK